MTKHTDDWKGEHLIRNVRRETKVTSQRAMQGNGYACMPRIHFGRGYVTAEMQQAVEKRRAQVTELFHAGVSSMDMIARIEGMTESVLRSDLHELGLSLRQRDKEKRDVG